MRGCRVARTRSGAEAGWNLSVPRHVGARACLLMFARQEVGLLGSRRRVVLFAECGPVCTLSLVCVHFVDRFRGPRWPHISSSVGHGGGWEWGGGCWRLPVSGCVHVSRRRRPPCCVGRHDRVWRWHRSRRRGGGRRPRHRLRNQPWRRRPGCGGAVAMAAVQALALGAWCRRRSRATAT